MAHIYMIDETGISCKGDCPTSTLARMLQKLLPHSKRNAFARGFQGAPTLPPEANHKSLRHYNGFGMYVRCMLPPIFFSTSASSVNAIWVAGYANQIPFTPMTMGSVIKKRGVKTKGSA